MSDNKIIKLQQEVDELEKQHKESLVNPTMTVEESLAIANQYTEKYKELQELGVGRVSEYKDS